MKKGSVSLLLLGGILTMSLFCACSVGFTEMEAKPPHKVGKGPPPWAPAHGYRAKFRYRYYPSVQIYYDVNRGLYFYFYMGKWRCGDVLPQGLKVKGEYVVLEMETDKPYEFHAEVLKRYPPGQKKGKGKRKGKKHW